MGKFLYNLSSAQHSIWLTEQFANNSSLNNVGGYVFIHDKVNFEYLEKAINIYVKRNPATNFKIKLVNGEPKQYLSDFQDFKIDLIELTSTEEVESLNKKIVNTPFNLFDSNLYRFTMFKLPDGTGGFNPTLHHIISDAWNMSLLIDQIMSVYSSLLHNEDVDLTPFPSYIDYIHSEDEYFNSSRFAKDALFWSNLFSTTPELSHISPNKKENSSSIAQRKIFNLNNDLYNKINDFCKENKCSIYTFFMAVYSLYVAKINNTRTSIIGTPVLNRSNFKEKLTSGMFISTVPFKVTIEPENTFASFVKDVGTTQISVFRHQKYPYDKLLQTVKKEHGISDNLYNFVLSYQNARDDKNSCKVNYSSNWLFNEHTLDTLEVHFYDMDDSGTISLYYDYQIDKLSEMDINNIHSRIMEITELVINNPDILLKNIPVVTAEEKHTLLNSFNTTCFDFDKNKSLVSIFEEQVSLNPTKKACIFEDKFYTYTNLNEKANNLAHMLVDNIGSNSIIGIMLPRSLNLFSCVWGVLKSGNGYMLIDPSLPQDRIRYMLENANASLLITNSDMPIDFNNKFLADTSELILNGSSQKIDFSNYSLENLDLNISNENTFCVIYTSGSTGTPKGVELKRIGVINMLHSYKHFLGTDNCDTFLSTSTVAFDMFIVENFVSLLSGKTVVLANDEEQKVPVFMSKLIKKYDVDFILSTPSKISLLLLNDDTKSCLKHVKVIQLGGEVFKEHLYNELKICTNAKIFNGYGPSECTACCSDKEIVQALDITIGKPFLNTNVYILNQDMNLLPIGYTGEICISGLGVGKGYINRPDLSNKAFVLDPFIPDKVMYKTGDMGKYAENGDLIFIGRRDSQVKLRGLRIELDEITNKIASMNEIVNAVSVIQKVNNIKCICSYVVKSDDCLTDEQIKDYLKDKLPHYMIPSHIVFMEALPITLNGKIDTKKLPKITVAELKYIAPETEIENVLADLWSKLLDIPKVSTNANFFDLGGDSLCSIKLVSEVYSKLNIKISIKDIFDFPTIKLLANHIEKLTNNSAEITKITKAENLNFYPLSSAQKRIYYTVQMMPESISYNTPGGLIFDKLPNIQKLEECFEILINRHSALRTYFDIENGEVVQKVVHHLDFKLDVIHSEEKNINEVFANFVKPFDLSKAPLFRACIHVLANNKCVLFIDMHHIICDGESIAIFVQELCKLYNGESLSENHLEYVDYSVWEQEQLNTDTYKQSESYWLKQFKDEIPILNMPTTFARPNIQSYDGAKVYGKIENSQKIFDLCKNLSTTPYMFLLSIYYILLYKYTKQTDMVVGSPIVGRDNLDISNILGMFVNTIALRTSINSKDTFKTFLSYVTCNCFNAFENQTYPFDELLKKLKVTRDTSRNPLFDTMFIYQNNGRPDVSLKGLKTEYYVPDNNTSKFDFSLEIMPENDDLSLSLEYCTKLFDKDFMERFLGHYINVLNEVLQNENILLADINILSNKEKQTLLNDFNNTYLEYPCDKTIMEIFEEQASLHLNHTAIIYKNEKLTYEDLQKGVNKLACFLTSLGIQKGDVVCTILPRSSDLIISLLAIMKCGAIYLPISTTFPNDRINYIIKDSMAKLVITHSDVKSITCNNLIFINQIDYMNINVSNTVFAKNLPEDVIYTIYTSGSTGNPKGVQITNKNLNNFIHSFKELYDNTVDCNDICLSTTSIAFDVSIWEIFFTLLNGATLCLYEKESIDDIFDYCNTLLKNNITMAYIPPNILDETYSILAEHKIDVKLSKILIGVEPIKTNIIMKYFLLNPDIKIVNGYGPTETTICTTAFKVNPSKNISYNIIPIGKPLHNMKAYVLDNDLNVLPTGIPGELYVCGDNVGHGYLNNTKLTNERYIPCPFEPDKLMYKTGDVVKMFSDGNLMFVGRNDNQIKIKGHRVEINEIVSAISEYPTITKCVVLVREEKENKSLASYFTANTKIIINDLRSFLSLKLPFYNIPNYFVQLNKFPLTANGKIDFKHLSNMALKTETVYELPRNDFEKQLVELWKEFLKVDKVGINDNFFDLGGDSLIAIKLQIEAFKLGINISYGDIFAYPTIKQLSGKATITSSNIDIKNFDYEKIDELINKNQLPIDFTPEKANIKNIMLTGSTGFVGAHILDKLLTNTDCTIYCLVRNKNNLDYISRLKKTLQFYFANKYDDFLGSRIKVIEGDISRKNLGLSNEDYKYIGNNISCIINSAAVVKHYGKSTLFDDTNIAGVKNIVNLCTDFGIKLYHISTLSVSGNVFAEDNFSGAQTTDKVTFRENNLFVGQDLSNVYIYTKFMAERIILEQISKGLLKGTIIRLGNITSRFSDGQFQINVSENAFLNRLLSFIKLKCIPDYLLEGYTEFTPVDSCAEAISKIVEYDSPYTILHLFNNKHINILKIINILNNYGLEIKFVDNDEFMKIVDISLKNDKNSLSGIINDFDINKKLVYDSNVTLNNNFTNQFLKKLSFDWPEIDEKYLYQYLDYLKTINYLD